MSFIDIVFTALLGYALYTGLKNGLFVEIASFGSLIIGIFVAIKFSYMVRLALEDLIKVNPKYIADFHIEVERPSNCAASNHHFALIRADFLEFFNIARVCPTNDIEKKSRRFDHFFLHLKAHHVAHQRDFADIEAAAARDFNQNHVART